MPTALETPFYANHVAANAKLVDFAGWSLPIHYGSLVDEHHAVRNDAGLFDVSHMTLTDVTGAAATQQLRLLLTNDIQKLTDNTALYSCLCRMDGGVIDDLIVYRIHAEHHRVISNAGTRAKVLDWLRVANGMSTINTVAAGDLAMLAVQGPNAVAKVQGLSETLFKQTIDISALPNFGCVLCDGGFIGRTGYTGEDGVEIVVPKAAADATWKTLIDAGVRPCGLGARDTLRLEAGMSLYGNDLDEQHSPFECGVGWTVDLTDAERAFIGRAALQEQKATTAKRVRIGVELSGRGVLRAGQAVCLGDEAIGVITSGTFSPSLQRTIALARVDRARVPEILSAADASSLSVQIRNKAVAAFRVALPFYQV